MADELGEDLSREDVAEELEWLQQTMQELEQSVRDAEKNCRKWTSARGVPEDVLKEIYGYLVGDMSNEYVCM